MTTINHEDRPARSRASGASPNRVREVVRAPVEVTESGPSLAARLVSGAARMTVHPALAIGCRALRLPWPYGILERATRGLSTRQDLVRSAVELPHAHAELLHVRGVTCDTGGVVLYCHGGAFLWGGISTHLRTIAKLSEFTDSPVLAVNYRTLPKHTLKMALDDCYDAYRWLRRQGYESKQIAIAGDSAGGYLAFALAQVLAEDGEEPAAMTLMSPLLRLAAERPDVNGAMLPHNGFAALTALITAHGEPLYEPLDHIKPGLPPTLIHVSGAEELVHDARCAAQKLAASGVPTDVRIWPGQVHAFQVVAPLVPEADRSLRHIGDYIRRAVSRDPRSVPAA